METIRINLRVAIAAAGQVLEDVSDSSALSATHDSDLLATAADIEQLGRVVDAARVAVAGEIGHRSRRILGSERLSYRLGCGSDAELLERATLISAATARLRLRLGERTRPERSLTGEALPSSFPAVRDALTTGRLGLDAAHIITTDLGRLTDRVPISKIAIAEHELVTAAIGAAPDEHTAAKPPVTPTETKIHAAAWAESLDADGAEPSERVFGARSFMLGRARNGLIPVSGLLLPEVAGKVQRVFDTLTNMRQSLKFLPHEERTALDAEERSDPRSRAQRQHDALATVFDVAGRSGDLPTLGGASATMIVTVSAEDYASGSGPGHVDGIDLPIATAAVRQETCTNGIQRVELAASGRIRLLGSTERLFNRHQRRALAARDGGCVIPGCTVAAWACEAHHVLPHEDGGETHVDNGVLLCWYHHRTIETSGWRIRMMRGSPEVMPPPWLGDQRWRPTTKSPVRLAQQITERLRQ